MKIHGAQLGKNPRMKIMIEIQGTFVKNWQCMKIHGLNPKIRKL